MRVSCVSCGCACHEPGDGACTWTLRARRNVRVVLVYAATRRCCCSVVLFLCKQRMRLLGIRPCVRVCQPPTPSPLAGGVSGPVQSLPLGDSRQDLACLQGPRIPSRVCNACMRVRARVFGSPRRARVIKPGALFVWSQGLPCRCFKCAKCGRATGKTFYTDAKKAILCKACI